ncbi:glucuronate isomerase [Roseibacillus persicicus]|uniref:glucuronate isomerase n=1 Tax=Roseibacillus persicicus TaxID=454148 RepID=UPI00280F3321|nr:glucuronate isomerase [Roseibacillus persicicus]MDQ8192339.1 glucuronate isomerase [Roseibacillus persicicus]
MKTFITNDFLLQSEVARELYHNYAKEQPIIDYHCHLPPDQIAENRTFENLYQVWLAGDHYKWRAMRSNGISERYCTGEGSDREKFDAFAKTVPKTLRNPLYHWTHLELQRYFGIDDLLDESSADAIWNEANSQLKDLPVHTLLEQSKVKAVCTTDDPVDSLEYHQQIKASGLSTKVYPTFRPDKALAVDQPEAFNAWTDKLSEASGVDCGSFGSFLDALKQRHDFFHEMGGRLSDHGLSALDNEDCSETEAAVIFDEARAGREVSPEKAAKFRTYLMVFFGHLDAEKGWTKQLHLGALRNNNTRLLNELGPDTGFDSIGDFPQGQALSGYLDRLDSDNLLPKTVIYNLNPADNYMMGAMIGNFQDGTLAGKIQFGSGWWFLDQKEGMEMQINALSNLGLLSRFVGMLTDSRSFLSYPRHEYFRRILCNLIGKDVVNGELPHDMDLLGGMVSDICYGNAKNYFGLELG